MTERALAPSTPRAADGLVWIDGDIRPIDGATVPLEDRGFMFADGVYEVLRAYAGRLFATHDHLERLARSAAGIRLALPLTTPEIGEVVVELMEQTGLGDAEVYIQATRGAARRNHLFPDVPGRLVIWVRPPRAMNADLWAKGCKAITLVDERWARCDLKTVSLLPNVLAKQAAYDAGAYEAVLVRDGFVTEGSASNLFLVLNGELVTPVADNRILPGITRAHVLRLAERLEIPFVERNVCDDELPLAQELFFTSTSLEVLGVAELDGRALAAPGPVTTRLAEAFAGHARGN
ncbi:MAG: dat [Cyanobacteria bacterium RYN_339]|nr:dat [Cyanobacteria bacterium RYN_339]